MGLSTDSLLNVFVEYIVRVIRAPAIATVLFFLLQPVYNALYRSGSQYMTDRIFAVLLLFTVNVVAYWTINTFFFICDEYGYLQQYKLPRTKHQIPSKALIWKTVKAAIIGQLIVDSFGGYFVMVPLWQKQNPSMIYDETSISNHKLYYILLIYSKFVFCRVGHSWIYYFAHRLLHNPLFYGRFHKQHHEYTGVISFAADYYHAIEAVLTNTGPLLFGAIITAAHPLQFAVWLAWRLQEAYEVHSGFAFHNTWLHSIGLTNADSTLFHDFHHSKNIGNYSETEIFCDAVFGTDKGWNQWYHNWIKSQKQKK